MPPAKPDIRMVAEAEALRWAAAEEFVRRVGAAVRARGFLQSPSLGARRPRTFTR
jgi:hypothetical protein